MFIKILKCTTHTLPVSAFSTSINLACWSMTGRGMFFSESIDLCLKCKILNNKSDLT